MMLASVAEREESRRIQRVSDERDVQHPEGQSPPRMQDVVPIVVAMAVRIVMTISTTRFQGKFFMILNFEF